MTAFPLTTFSTPAQWRAWLKAHHKSATAIVLRLRKAHATNGITYAEALDEALCFGWIDGVRRAHDSDSYTIRFTPRRAGSIWSRVNVRHAERLLAAGRMTAAGRKAFEARRENRTGLYSFEQPRSLELAPAYKKTFRARKPAWEYYEDEAPWYRRATIHWVMSARQEETRQRRLAALIDWSSKGLRIPQLRRP